MRIVTWNINGLASLKFPFHIHAHHTHRYPPAAVSGSQQRAPCCDVPDEYECDDSASTDSPHAAGAGPAVLPSVDAAVSPHDAAFPAFPADSVALTDELVGSYDELIAYFQADIVCLQEVKIGRARMDLLHKAVSHSHAQTRNTAAPPTQQPPVQYRAAHESGQTQNSSRRRAGKRCQFQVSVPDLTSPHHVCVRVCVFVCLGVSSFRPSHAATTPSSPSAASDR